MKVNIDKAAGFCPGVRHAISKAEDELRKGEGLASLGSLLHNEKEMRRLEECGLTLAGKDDIPKMKGKKLLFRTHGEPPESFELTHSNGVDVIDATCGVVRQLQKKIRDAVNEMEEVNGQVLIYGKEGHAEVIGLMGQTRGRGILIRNSDDLSNIDFKKPVRLFSQTTMDIDAYDGLVKELGVLLQENGNNDFISNNTICRHVLNRIPSLKEFARKHDVLIFVSGRNSSNGNKLYKISKEVNPSTYFITGPEELRSEWFDEAELAGVSGAASTPQWLMEDVAEKIKRLS